MRSWKYFFSFVIFALIAPLLSFAASPIFYRSLTIGSQGEDVRELQKFLNSQGFSVSSTGAGSPGNETDYFGALTRSAVARYQAAENISPAVGYFGPITRANIFEKLSAKISLPDTIPSVSEPPSLSAPPSLLSFVSESDIRISAEGISSPETYSQRFLASAVTLPFSQEELSRFISAYGRVLSLPDLLKELSAALREQNDARAASARRSLATWQRNTLSTAALLKTFEVAPSLSAHHKTLIGWYLYSEAAARTGAILESADAVDVAAREYASAYSEARPAIQTLLGITTLSAKRAPSLQEKALAFIKSLIQVARATTPPGFGGLLTISNTCTTGELLSVVHPSGIGSGAFFLYWTVYSINPYYYNAVYDGNWILGYYFPYPGICCYSGTDCHPEGMGTVVFFGTSLAP